MNALGAVSVVTDEREDVRLCFNLLHVLMLNCATVASPLVTLICDTAGCIAAAIAVVCFTY